MPSPDSTRRRGPRRWAWTEPTVWTDRMLTALEQGVQGGKWFRLIDKVAEVEAMATWIHRLWPNTFFAERGLFSLVAAHRLVRQPSL